MNRKIILRSYFKVIVVNYCILIALRLLETILVLLNYGYKESLLSSEIIGLPYDFITTNLFLIIFYPLFYFLSKHNTKIANVVFLSVIGLITTLHLIILKYFLYQLIPLDIFLFQYSIGEIFFTVSTSNISYLGIIIFIFVFLAIIFLIFRISKKIQYSKKLIQLVYLFIILSLPLFIITHKYVINDFNIFSKNKSLYFYSRSLGYLFNSNQINDNYTRADSKAFQELYQQKEYLNTEYPLLHSFDTLNTIGSCFKKFDSVPNIVILIVEGLNDDFIHEFKDVNLMPFLSNFKDKCLYWNRCFTLGERSFAVVPSLLGSLPYGKIGFTLLDRLPRHLSLVSVLNSNNYYTSFFYGQASWFHRKDRFFGYNDIDLIVDNRKFSNKYKKIIVGDDNYFWGYNDKDLFNQSFEVLDTLKAKQRLDIYYTGTSHSPFVLSDDIYYEKYYLDVLHQLKSESNIKFFNTYKRYIKSVLFVDDALKDFFHKYQKRDDYKNTIFVITGDHPMTEIPIANSLKKYHVPLLIFSEKLIKPQKISNITSHLDFYETILSLLRPYGIRVPSVSSALGGKLHLDQITDKSHIAFMNDNRDIVDFYSEGYFISDKNTYKVDKDFDLIRIDNEEISATLNHQLNIFKKTNLYTSMQNKIISNAEFCNAVNQPLFSSKKNKKFVHFNSEYYNLVDALKLKNQNMIYNIDFKSYSKSGDFTMVYLLKDKNDSILFWQNSSVYAKDGYYYQSHIKIPKQTISDSDVYFKSYFWNANKKEIKFSDLNILIHGNL